MKSIDIPNEFTNDKSIIIEKKFYWIIKLLQSTLIYYGNKGTNEKNFIQFYIKIFIAYFLTLKNIYDLIFYIYQWFNHWEEEKNIIDMVMVTWCAQCCFSMISLLYWQYSGYISNILIFIDFPKNSKHYDNNIKSVNCLIVISLIIYFMYVIFFMFMTIVYHFFPANNDEFFDLNNFNVFLNPKFIILNHLFTLHKFYVWNVIITFYIIISKVLLYKLQLFNKNLTKIGNKDEASNEIFEQLQKMFITHIEMSKCVRVVDKTFKVYVFIMVATNVPTTIFSLLSFMKTLNRSWINILMSIPPILFSIVELIGLTAFPALLHDTIKKVERIIYVKRKIWYPFNENVYYVADALVSHIRQTNLGITLWGFAVVSKPLILTTISLILTYLCLLLQLAPKDVFLIANHNNNTISDY